MTAWGESLPETIFFIIDDAVLVYNVMRCLFYGRLAKSLRIESNYCAMNGCLLMTALEWIGVVVGARFGIQISLNGKIILFRSDKFG